MKKFLYTGGAALYTLIYVVLSIIAVTLNEILDCVSHIYVIITESPDTFRQVLKETLQNDE